MSFTVFDKYTNYDHNFYHHSGIQQAFLYFDKELGHWIVQSLRDKRFTLHTKHFRPDYPLGRMLWLSCKKTAGQNICDEKDEEQRVLTFTSCVGGEFTCDSGHCVDDIGY